MSEVSTDKSIPLSPREQEELYIMLRRNEEALNAPLETVLFRIEKSLFDRMSIDEMERIQARVRER